MSLDSVGQRLLTGLRQWDSVGQGCPRDVMIINLFVTLSEYVYHHRKKGSNKFLCNFESFVSSSVGCPTSIHKGLHNLFSFSISVSDVFFIRASHEALSKLQTWRWRHAFSGCIHEISTDTFSKDQTQLRSSGGLTLPELEVSRDLLVG